LPLDGTRFTLNTYRQVWSGAMGRAVLNSFAITIPAIALPIVFASVAAYAFTFMRLRGRSGLFAVIVSLLVVPMLVILVPLLRLYLTLNLAGTFAAVYLTHAGYGMPMAVYILGNFMRTLPKEIVDIAKVDGASDYQIFWRVVMPLCVPALAAFATFQFLWVWNDLLVALIFLGQGERETVTVALGGQVGAVGSQGWQLVSGGAIVAISVPVLVFIALQRYFIRGLTSGSLNG
jgi:alpha-glucoside transport system permease protein